MKFSSLKLLVLFFIPLVLLLNVGCSDDDNSLVPIDDPVGITFENTYGSLNAETGYSVCLTSDGGYLVVGGSRLTGLNENDMYIVKADSLGDSLWAKSIGVLGSYETGHSIIEASDGSFIITGTYSSDLSNYDVSLKKLNASGEQVWDKTFGGLEYDGGNSIIETSDGGFLIAGRTASFGVDSTDVYLIKTDNNGDTLWTKTFGGLGHEYANSVSETTDGGFIITGQTSSSSAGRNDVYLIKTNSNGDSLWAKTIGGASSDWGSSVSEISSGGFIIVGATSSYGVGATDVYLIKTDTNGDTLWTKTFGEASYDYGYSVCEAADGGYVFTGGIDTTGDESSVANLIKTDINGNTVWEKVIGQEVKSRGHFILNTEDGGYIIAGIAYSQGTNGNDFYLIKTDANGYVE